MRIAVLSRNFSSTGGGAERYSIAVVEQLAQRHEVHVFAQTIAHRQEGITYHRVHKPCEKPRWINQLWFALETWWRTRRGFDVVHSHENTWHGNVQTVHVLPVKHNLFDGKAGAALALRWLKVLTSPRLLTYWWLERARYAVGTGRKRIVLTSQALHGVMMRCYPQAAASMEVITPGIGLSVGLCSIEDKLHAREQLGIAAGERLALFVGNDFHKKGLDFALQALTKLPTEVHLLVVGRGEKDAAMRVRVADLQLAARVHFVGLLQEMDAAYRAADCLVHPTLEDTYAMVVLEALSHGLPVVVSGAQFCGISADLVDGVQALVLPDPHDVDALAYAMRRVLTDAALAADLSRNAQQFAEQHTWQDVAKRYESSYAAVSPSYRERWLILAHAFNMDGRAASQTITDKLPHLERDGIELVILSGVSGRKDTHYEHHQLWPSGPAGIRFEMRHVLRKRWGSGVRYRSAMLLISLVLLPFMLVEKLLRPVESSWSWWLSAYAVGRLLIHKKPFDLIYSTGGAFAAHLAGAALQRATGTRWLAEVHDPMVVPGTVPHTPQQKMQAKVEREICEHANVAIWFTDQALASALKRNPALGDRGHVMLPGVDRPPYDLTPYARGEKMVIGHFGSLSPTRNLANVMAALDTLLDQHPAWEGKVELQVTGGPLDPMSAQALARMRHPSSVRHFGRIEADLVTGKSGREQILQRMRSADVLLLVHGMEPICAEYIPSKMYEYLWMQRPILATVHQNPQMAQLLRSLGHEIVDTSNFENQSDRCIGEIESHLIKYIETWTEYGLPDTQIDNLYTTYAAVQRLQSYL